MLPYKEIWDNIIHIHAYKIPCNMKRTQDKVGYTLDDFLEMKEEFFISTFEYANNIAGIVTQYNAAIDFSFRYKDEHSIERNWHKNKLTKPLYKVLNDLLGIRLILPVNREYLNQIVNKFQSFCPLGEDKCRINNLEKDGYHGIHLYIKFNNNVFPIEVQFWTRVDALLNQYLRDSIYTRYDDPEILTYANNLRHWLEKIPHLPEGRGIKLYIDYLYEKAFYHDKREET